jgi:hypothetical protein
VPTAGTGGAAGANDGVAGGDVTFGSLCTAKGAPTPTGNGAATGLAAVGGTGGPASGTGTVKVQGNPGHPGSVGTSIATVIGSGGNGGAGPWGGAGLGAIASADGGVGTGCGSGGGGAASTSTNNQAGGDAAKGCAVVTEFLSQ